MDNYGLGGEKKSSATRIYENATNFYENATNFSENASRDFK